MWGEQDPAKTSRKLDEILTKLKKIDPKERSARIKVLRLMEELNALNANDIRMVNLYKRGLKYDEGPNSPQYKGLKKLVETYPNDAVGKEAEGVFNPMREKYKIWMCGLPRNMGFKSFTKLEIHKPSMCVCCGESERLTWHLTISYFKDTGVAKLDYVLKLPLCVDCAPHSALNRDDPTLKKSLKKSCRALPAPKANIAYFTESNIWFRNKDFAYEFARLNNVKIKEMN